MESREFLYIGYSGGFRGRMSKYIRGRSLDVKSFSSCVCVVSHFNEASHNTCRDFEFFIFKSIEINRFFSLRINSTDLV